MFISLGCHPASFLVQGLKMGKFSNNSLRLNVFQHETVISVFMKKQFSMEQAQNELV